MAGVRGVFSDLLLCVLANLLLKRTEEPLLSGGGASTGGGVSSSVAHPGRAGLTGDIGVSSKFLEAQSNSSTSSFSGGAELTDFLPKQQRK